MALKAKTELYVAYQGGCMSADGGEFAWQAGDRFQAEHPVVKRLGATAFVPDGTPADEIPNLFVDVVARMPEFGPKDHGGSLTLRYRCIKNVRADVDGTVLTAKKGDMLEPNDDLPRISPASFEATYVPA